MKASQIADLMFITFCFISLSGLFVGALLATEATMLAFIVGGFFLFVYATTMKAHIGLIKTHNKQG